MPRLTRLPEGGEEATSTSTLGVVRRALFHTLPMKSLTTASAPGLYGVRPRILTYRPSKVPHLEMFGNAGGMTMGVLFDKLLWFQAVVCAVIAISIAETTRPYNLNHTPEDGDLDEHAERLEAVKVVESSMSTLVAFLLGGFVSNVIGTWKERRTNYASLIGTMRNLLLNLSSFISHTPGMGEELSEAQLSLIRTSRPTLGRYVLLACELAVLKPRGHMDTEKGFEYLKALGLVTPAEWSAMVPGDRHTSVLTWVQTICVGLRRQGILDKEESSCIADAVSGARAQANDLMASLNRDLPLPYANLVAWLVKFGLLIETMFVAMQYSKFNHLSARTMSVVCVAKIFVLAHILSLSLLAPSDPHYSPSPSS